MTEREKMLCRLSSAEFAAHELHIYLDTHPDDAAAGEALNKYEQQSAALRKDFESRFGPLTAGDDGNRWAWIADPWPWDIQEG